jgi:hypothetical protein
MFALYLISVLRLSVNLLQSEKYYGACERADLGRYHDTTVSLRFSLLDLQTFLQSVKTLFHDKLLNREG